MILYLKTANHKQLAIGNTYWPTKPLTQNEAPGQRPEPVLNNSLWNKYVKWLRAAGSRETPITYLRRCMEMRFDKHMEKGFPAILMGTSMRTGMGWVQPTVTLQSGLQTAAGVMRSTTG